MGALRRIDDRTAAEAIEGTDGVVLVEFTAEWCSPCRMMEPLLERLDREQPDVTVLQVDGDACPELLRRYDVMAFPTVFLFRDGRPARRLVGARGHGALVEEIERVRSGVDA